MATGRAHTGVERMWCYRASPNSNG